MTRRPEKPTLQIDPALAAVRGGMVLAETIAKLGGTVRVAADGEVKIDVEAEHDEAARAAVRIFEGA